MKVDRLKGLIQSRDMKVDRRKGLIQSRDMKVDRRKGLIQSRDMKVDRRKGLIQSRDMKVDRRKGLIQSRAMKVDRRKGLIQSRDMKVDRRKGLIQSRDMKVDRRKGLIQSRDMKVDDVRTITNDIWIGLYGNGTNFVWQNMVEAVSYANWNTTAPQIYSGVAVVMTKSDFTWRGRQMTDRTGHALCQVNYLPVVSGLTYAEAKAECLKYALHPALLRTQEEHIIAKNALNTPNTITDTFWVGLTLNGTQFTWSDGTPALFTDWMQGEPNNMDIAKCVIIVGSEFRWDSKDCTRLNNLLCQCDITQRNFLLNGLDVEPQNQPYHVTQCQSKIRCADHCLSDHVCAAFVFNGWQCLLYNSFNSGSVNHIVGSTIWK
ncbi:MRC [Mytilus coruscus]|uniref:MRC n=1 Tax=Mytilus coruscus TaxID=42192 RepID=A0A6J8AHD7_MYTCO|nr:MRC [Mytilus coruscus]